MTETRKRKRQSRREEERSQIRAREEQKKKELCAQKRTGQHKKNVYVTEKYVYKGPYERESTRLQTAVARHLLLGRVLGDPTVQTPKLVQWSDGWYLRFTNIATRPRGQWQTRRTTTLKGREAFTLVERESMGIQQVSKCLMQLTSQQKLQVLYHLVLRFCCAPAIGDSHLGNMLYNGKSVYGVDLEDYRKHTQIRQVENGNEFVSLLFTKHQERAFMECLTDTLLQHKKELLAGLRLAAHVVSGPVLEPITRFLPEADINLPLMQERLQHCISLLSSQL